MGRELAHTKPPARRARPGQQQQWRRPACSRCGRSSCCSGCVCNSLGRHCVCGCTRRLTAARRRPSACRRAGGGPHRAAVNPVSRGHWRRGACLPMPTTCWASSGCVIGPLGQTHTGQQPPTHDPPPPPAASSFPAGWLACRARKPSVQAEFVTPTPHATPAAKKTESKTQVCASPGHAGGGGGRTKRPTAGTSACMQPPHACMRWGAPPCGANDGALGARMYSLLTGHMGPNSLCSWPTAQQGAGLASHGLPVASACRAVQRSGCAHRTPWKRA